MKWKLSVALAAIAATVAVFALNPRAKTWAQSTITKLSKPAAKHAPEAEPPPIASRPAFDGKIDVTESQKETIGLQVVDVRAETDPIQLEVNGKTDYDQETLSQIHPRFASEVRKVYVSAGQRVEVGDPLVDLFSVELAKAKGEFEKAQAKWEMDKKQLKRSEDLHSKGAMSDKEYTADVTDEAQSAVDAKVATDMLLIYGLSKEEVANVPKEDGEQKGKLTLRSPARGIVLNRTVAPGTIYDTAQTLLQIGPLDHFWVWGNVYPADASRVHLGLDWIVELQTMNAKIRCKVESVTSSIDPETRTFRIRTTIPNVNDRVKADLLVGGQLLIPPFTKGRVVVPRVSMVSTDERDYVFVSLGGKPEQFTRREVRIVEEKDDRVILVGDSLKPGERVAARGSLILAQIYEDEATTDSGTPLGTGSPGDGPKPAPAESTGSLGMTGQAAGGAAASH